MAKHHNSENQAPAGNFELPEGFARSGSANAVGWFDHTTLGNMARGSLVGMFRRPDQLKGPKGETSTLEARSEKNLAAVKVGDRVAIRYFEGVQIRKKKPGEAVPVPSLKDGIIGAKLGRTSKTKHAIIASVEAIDQADQEVTLKGPDGSLETIMVTDPEYLERIEVGDQVVLTRSQALALSIDKED